jgi:hypothetical protein
MRGIFQLEAKQKLESFNRIISPINKITHEYVSAIWNFSSFIEKLKKIMKLTVNIAANNYWSSYWLNVTFLNK